MMKRWRNRSFLPGLILVAGGVLWPLLQAGATSAAPPASVAQTAQWSVAPGDAGNRASLQNGARQYLQTCISCHSAQYMRFDRLQEIGLTAQDVRALMPDNPPSPGTAMLSPLPAEQAVQWFGAAPPDLSLFARTRDNFRRSGADYVYSYLRGFYQDPSSRSGWNCS